MLLYIIRRVIMLVPILIVMSMVAFFLIQLPPGDYVTMRIEQMRMSGISVDEAVAEQLTIEFGLDQPPLVRYFRWVSGIVTRGYWGRSLQWNKPVHEILAERVPLTILISVSALLFSWGVAIPIGIYSATHQYSIFDYVFTFLGFIGVATPGFLLALILMYVGYTVFGVSAGGLFSPEYEVVRAGRERKYSGNEGGRAAAETAAHGAVVEWGEVLTGRSRRDEPGDRLYRIDPDTRR